MGIKGPVFHTTRTRAIRKAQRNRRAVEVPLLETLTPEPVIEPEPKKKRIPLVILDEPETVDTLEETDESSL